MGLEMILEDDYCRVGHLPGTSDTVFLSFTGIGHGMGAIQIEEFAGSASQAGENHVVFITDKTRSWSNHLDHARISAAISPILGDLKVVCLGNSMGAFNAVIYSGLYHVDTCIGFAPQYSVSRDVIPDERRWKNHVDRINEFKFRELGPYFSDQTTYFLFSGNEPQERRHFARIPNRRNIQNIVVDDIGHGISSHIKSRGVLGRLIQACATREGVSELVDLIGGRQYFSDVK